MPVELEDQEQPQVEEVDSTPTEYRVLRLTKADAERMRQTLWEHHKLQREAATLKKRWFCYGVLSVLIPLFLYSYVMMIRCSPHW